MVTVNLLLVFNDYKRLMQTGNASCHKTVCIFFSFFYYQTSILIFHTNHWSPIKQNILNRNKNKYVQSAIVFCILRISSLL